MKPAEKVSQGGWRVFETVHNTIDLFEQPAIGQRRELSECLAQTFDVIADIETLNAQTVDQNCHERLCRA